MSTTCDRPAKQTGIDFGPFFWDIVTDALTQLGEAVADELRQAEGVNPGDCIACFLLNLEPAPRPPETQFVRRGDLILVTGKSPPYLPEAVPIEVVHKADVFRWHCYDVQAGPSVLLERKELCASLSQEVVQCLERLKWHALIRLEQDGRFVGYYKIVRIGADGSVTSDTAALKDIVRNAFYEVKSYVIGRIIERKLNSPGFLDKLAKTNAVVERDGFHVALRHVANLITSHHGARWNRAAFLTRVSHRQSRLRVCPRRKWRQGVVPPRPRTGG